MTEDCIERGRFAEINLFDSRELLKIFQYQFFKFNPIYNIYLVNVLSFFDYTSLDYYNRVLIIPRYFEENLKYAILYHFRHQSL